MLKLYYLACIRLIEQNLYLFWLCSLITMGTYYSKTKFRNNVRFNSLFFLFIATFWSFGVGLYFFVVAVNGFDQLVALSPGAWFALLFSTPFVLVGILAWYMFLQYTFFFVEFHDRYLILGKLSKTKINWEKISRIVVFYQEKPSKALINKLNVIELLGKLNDEIDITKTHSTTISFRRDREKQFKDALEIVLKGKSKVINVTWAYQEPKDYTPDYNDFDDILD